MAVMNFIINRNYILTINGEKTKHYMQPKSWVPQGSHCGPLLFILYIDNLKTILDINYKLYADDIKIYKSIDNENDAKNTKKYQEDK